MTHTFTPTYIAMAKAAEEIRAMRPVGTYFLLGDWYWWDTKDRRGEVVSLSSDYDRSPDAVDEGLIWIPLLHQILAMLDGPCSFVHAIAHAGDGPGIYFINEADEQRDWHELALAVVMKEKYGKTWRDGVWVK